MESKLVQKTSSKHLIVNTNEASIVDIFHVLLAREMESKEYIDAPIKEKTRLLEHTGIVALSMALQKGLQVMSSPMQIIGSNIEKWLNVLGSNNNLASLLVKLYQAGNVVWPDEKSVNYKSFVGILDERVELDKNIKPEDNKYFPALCALASKLAYENAQFIKATVEDRWKMEYLGAYDFWNVYQKRHSTQGFMFHVKNGNHNKIIVAFRGTEPFDADSWSTDVDISWFKFKGVGKVHSGFMKALGLQEGDTWPPTIVEDKDHKLAYYTIRNKLKNIFENDKNAKFIVTGHSLGGALAILFPAVLVLLDEEEILERLEAIYTFGQPRVGDKKFGDYMMEKLVRGNRVKYYRFVNNNDIVPRLPFDNPTMMFKHFGTCVFYNSLFEGKIVEEEPEKNYFDMKAIVTRRIDALWEFVRSFILPYAYGPDYKESYTLQGLRLFGLLFPGLPDHAPQNYVNALQLGNDDIFY